MATDKKIFDYGVLSLLFIAPPTFICLQFLIAPYGKHNRPGWGPNISPPLAWFLMESPTVWLTLILFPLGRHRSSPQSLALISTFLLHYFHRTCIYPLRLHIKTMGEKKTSAGIPVSIALMAFNFNFLNSYLQTRWVSHYSNYGIDEWFWWRFAGGLLVFATGMVVNVWSDLVLLGLKSEGVGYKIPRGGLYEMVSCPNYLGEILEWVGWAVMTWSWAGLSFLVFTCANLVPRARQNHRWYLQKFGEDYPKTRAAVIPFIY